MKPHVHLFTIFVSCVVLVAPVGCSKKDAPGHGSAKEQPGEHADEDEHGHDEKGGPDRKGEPGHDEHEEKAGHEGHDEPEEGVVELSPEAAAQARIRTAPVQERNVPYVLRTTARVDYDERRLAHVSPRIPGRVARVDAELGDNVKAGQALASLDSIELGAAKADFMGARAEVSLARKTREREDGLFAEKITSEQSALEARTAHEKALIHFRSSEEKLRLLGLSNKEIGQVRYGDPKASTFSLVAPMDGRIVEKHLVAGELVTPEEKVFTVADLSHLWIWIDVYERDLSRVHKEDTVVVVTQAWPGRTFEGHVAYIGDRVDPDTRAARARIDIPNPEGALKPGMFAEVVLTDPHGGNSERKALAVPPSAVQRDGERTIAFVQEGERRYERRTLRIGAQTDEIVEVIEGLSPGDLVVVEGAFLLKSEAAKEEMGGGHSH